MKIKLLTGRSKWLWFFIDFKIQDILISLDWASQGSYFCINGPTGELVEFSQRKLNALGSIAVLTVGVIRYPQQIFWDLIVGQSLHLGRTDCSIANRKGVGSPLLITSCKSAAAKGIPYLNIFNNKSKIMILITGWYWHQNIPLIIVRVDIKFWWFLYRFF